MKWRVVCTGSGRWRVHRKSDQYPCVQDVYSTFNVFMRRRPKENNFKVSQWVPLPSSCLHYWDLHLLTACSGDHPVPHEHRVCGPRLAARHLPGLRGPCCSSVQEVSHMQTGGRGTRWAPHPLCVGIM